jgi:ABC-type nitrate/sulfonate/bicarbonate transport system substrate-binding protein
MNIRKLTALVLLGLTLTVIAGCGGGNTSVTPTIDKTPTPDAGPNTGTDAT